MPKQEARTQALLRDRQAAKRRLQLWLALTAIWGVVLGWAAWGLIGMLADDSDAVAWATYAIPLAVLAIGSLVAWLRVRRIDSDLVAVAETH